MAFWNNFTDLFKSTTDIKQDIDDLLIKADIVSENQVPDITEDNETANKLIGRKAILDDPYFNQLSQSVIFRHKMSRLSNKMLKDVSVRDWLISSIIQVRADTLLRFSRISHDK